MARVYADLIRKGFKTLEEVPDKLKAAVKAILDGNGSCKLIQGG